MQVVYLILASVLTVLLIIHAVKGVKFNSLSENLDDKDFPLKGLYVIGFSWSESGALSLKGKMREKLVSQAKLLYDPKYAEYYATLVWAQVLTFVHIGLLLGFLLAGLMNSGLMILIGVAIAGVCGFYFLNHMNDLLKDREKECTYELPEIVSTMALLVNAGMMLREAWRNIADSKEGVVYDLMRKACVDMDNGMSEIDAIHKFGLLTNSNEVRKFTGALVQSMEHGGGELSDFLGRQSTEIWSLKKQVMLQKGEAAATKLLIPTVLLFLAIIVAVFSGALGMIMGS